MLLRKKVRIARPIAFTQFTNSLQLFAITFILSIFHPILISTSTNSYVYLFLDAYKIALHYFAAAFKIVVKEGMKKGTSFTQGTDVHL